MKPLDQITGVKFLKTHGVQKIYTMQTGGFEAGAEKRVFILKPFVNRMKLLAEYINLDKMKGIKRKCQVIFTPTKLSTCDIILEQEGIYGDLTVEEFNLDLIRLDTDVVTMEMPLYFKQFFLDNDTTWYHSIARALSSIQGTFGTIPKAHLIGLNSMRIHDLWKMKEDRDYNPPGGPEIGSMIMLDRNLDFPTVLASQLTYEGLIAECFGIKTGVVKFEKNVTSQDAPLTLSLNSTDKVFAEIRGMHITGVFPLLSSKARQLQSGYDKKDNLSSVSDFKQFVSEDLKELKSQHKSLALHIGACEAIMNKKTEGSFEDVLAIEQAMFEDTQYKDSLNFVETCIQRQSPYLNCLRMMSLLSVCKGGIDSKTYKSLRTQFLHSFGFHHMTSFKKFKEAGLINETNDKRNLFPKSRKKFNLIPKSPEAASKGPVPKDLSYVFGGAYTPFLVKIVEQLLTKPYVGGMEEMLKSLQIPATEYKAGTSARQTQGNFKPSQMALKTVLVVFIGGCTHTEINALRFIGNQLRYRFIILTTAIVTGEEFLQSFLV
eukprot:TCONS_00029175-protein